MKRGRNKEKRGKEGDMDSERYETHQHHTNKEDFENEGCLDDMTDRIKEI
jgi:hypothetical protein